MSLMLVNISEPVLDEQYLKGIIGAVAKKSVIVSGGTKDKQFVHA